MARRFRKKASRGRQKPSILSMAPIAVVGYNAYAGFTRDGAKGMVQDIIGVTTGYDVFNRKFDINYAMPFYGTVVGTYVAKKLVGMTGVNKALKGLPFRL